MPKIKIIWVESFAMDDYDSRQVARCIDPSEFEEVTMEELQQLRVNRGCFPRPSYNMEPVFLILDEVPMSVRLDSIRDILKKQEESRLREEEKRKLAAVKRKLTKEQKERAQLAELKKKYKD